MKIAKATCLNVLALFATLALACSKPSPSPTDEQAQQVGWDATILRSEAKDQRELLGKCPTLADPKLLAGVKEHKGSTVDPWGTPYALNCDSAQITVTSAGPDKTMGTADDIVGR